MHLTAWTQSHPKKTQRERKKFYQKNTRKTWKRVEKNSEIIEVLRKFFYQGDTVGVIQYSLKYSSNGNRTQPSMYVMYVIASDD